MDTPPPPPAGEEVVVALDSGGLRLSYPYRALRDYRGRVLSGAANGRDG